MTDIVPTMKTSEKEQSGTAGPLVGHVWPNIVPRGGPRGQQQSFLPSMDAISRTCETGAREGRISVLMSAGSSSGASKSDAADRSSGPRIVRHLEVGGMVRLFWSPSDLGSTGPDSPPTNRQNDTSVSRAAVSPCP